MKIKVPNNHCKGCVWLREGLICSFFRCIKHHGWSIDLKKGEGK